MKKKKLKKMIRLLIEIQKMKEQEEVWIELECVWVSNWQNEQGFERGESKLGTEESLEVEALWGALPEVEEATDHLQNRQHPR